MDQRILFCNVAYIQFYDIRFYDKPENGGSYVSKYGDAYEKYNFQEQKMIYLVLANLI